MKSVTMRKTRRGSPDGVTVLTYTAGETYDMVDDLADVYLGNGDAVPAEPEPEPDRADDPDDGAGEGKEAPGPAENKSLGGPADNKGESGQEGDGPEDEDPEDDGGEGAEKPALTCQHLGFGKWQVVDGEGNVVSEGVALNKKQAQTWADTGQRPDGL